MLTVSTFSGLTPASAKAALHAAVCNWVIDVFLNEPPNVPNAVLLAPTMKTPRRKCVN